MGHGDSEHPADFPCGAPCGACEPTRLLIAALRRGDAAGVRSALAAGADADFVDISAHRRTPLHIAAACPTPGALIAFLRALPVAPPLRADAAGRTALHVCARHCAEPAPLFLLAAAYGPNAARDARGETFLHCLAANGRMLPDALGAAAALLLEGLAPALQPLLCAVSLSGESPLDAALRAGAAHVARAFIAAGGRDARDVVAEEERGAREAIAAEECGARRDAVRNAHRQRSESRAAGNRAARCAASEERRRRRIWLKENSARVDAIEAERASRPTAECTRRPERVGTEQREKIAESSERPQKTDSPESPKGAESPESPQRAESPESPRGAESPESPQRAESPESPQRAESPESPQRAESPESPKGAESPESPQRAESPESPQRAESPESPKGAESPESPQRAESPESPQRAESPESPQRAESPESPQRAESPESPQRAESPESPKGAESPECPQRAESPESPQRAESPESPQRAESPESPKGAESPECPQRAESPESPKGAESPEIATLLTAGEALALRRAAAARICVWYSAQQRRRLFIRSAAASVLQRVWRMRLARLARATDVVRSVLERHSVRRQLRLCVDRGNTLFVCGRIRCLTSAVTRLLWRENFLAALRDIVFRRRCRSQRTTQCAAGPRQNHNYNENDNYKCNYMDDYDGAAWAKTQFFASCLRWRNRMSRWVLLAQFVLSLFLLCFLAGTARAGYMPASRAVDATVSFLLLALQPALPLSPWRAVDVVLSAAAFVCACAGHRFGVCAAALLTLKFPFVVRAFLPAHSGTRTYCRAMEQAALHMALLSPIGAAWIGVALRGAARSDALLSRGGNAGAVLLALWSTLAAQYRVDRAHTNITIDTHKEPTVPLESPLGVPAALRMTGFIYSDGAGNALVRERLPVALVIVASVALRLWTWAAVFIAVHDAVRTHYDISDEAKLRKETARMCAPRRRTSTRGVHRADDTRALGRRVDGRLWEADVRAAKEAIDASHCDHKAGNTVHRFVRKVQDSVVAGKVDIGRRKRNGAAPFAAPITADWGKWDCRNEDPESRFKYDVFIIETALGLRERLSYVERLIRRQWIGAVDRRETTPLLVVILALAAAKPNCYPLEVAISTFFVIELVLSFRYTRVEFIFHHALQLLIRLFCVVVGYVPTAIPFAILRSLRFFEGWSNVLPIDCMTRYSFLYLGTTLFTMWMISFVSMWQFQFESENSLCHGGVDCFTLSLREMVLPVWTPTHIDVKTEAPVACVVIVLFQLGFVPFAVAFSIHPLLQLSGFIGRFIRLVVQSLHRDVVEYIHSYIEGPVWFSHWRLCCGLPASTVAKLRMCVHDFRHRRQRQRQRSYGECQRSYGECHKSHESLRPPPHRPSASYSVPHIRGFHACVSPGVAESASEAGGAKDTKGMNSVGDAPFSERVAQEESILSRAQFATFEENDAYHNPCVARRRALAHVFSALRWPPLHYMNMTLTLVSIVFLWVVDSTSRLPEPAAVVGIVVHALSAVFSLVLVPRDASALLTFVALSALIAAIALQYGSGEHHFLFALRFLSLLRLGQIQVGFFSRVRSLARLMIHSWIGVLFPLIITGAVVYVVEVMRSQVFLVHMYAPDAIVPPNASLPVRLASVRRRRHDAYPDEEDVRALLSHFFIEDAPVLYAILCLWLLPACGVATALAFLRWTGANLPDAPCAPLGDAVRLLEDPAAIAHFFSADSASPSCSSCSSFFSSSVSARIGMVVRRWLHPIIGHAGLAASLLSGLLLSPTTGGGGNDNHHNHHRLFFATEAAWAMIGCGDAALRVHFAMRRAARAWDVWDVCDAAAAAAPTAAVNTVLLLAEVAQLLYWALALPLAFTLLVERSACLFAPEQYALYVVALRFTLLLRMLPHRYTLFLLRRTHFFAYAFLFVALYVMGAASVLADVHVSASTGRRMSGALLLSAAEDLLRQIFTDAAPARVEGLWAPGSDSAARLREMIAAGEAIAATGAAYSAPPLLFALALVGKVVVASVCGLLIGVAFVPLRALIFGPLPRGARFLHEALSGGPNGVAAVGARLHLRALSEQRAQRQKFARLFTPRGIPLWLLPHLLEELGLCRPGRQRRFLFALEQLFAFLPVAEGRARCVAAYVEAFGRYASGGPARLSFARLPVFPPAADLPAARFVQPLRLVQAIALFETDFPPHSSVGSMIWLEFFKVAQRVRGATLLQSLWRMYAAVRAFEADPSRSAVDIAAAHEVRRAVRRGRMLSGAAFLSHASFEEAVRCQPNIFNHGAGHYDVLDRLRGHYDALQPTGPGQQLSRSFVLSPLWDENASPASLRHNPLSEPPLSPEE